MIDTSTTGSSSARKGSFSVTNRSMPTFCRADGVEHSGWRFHNARRRIARPRLHGHRLGDDPSQPRQIHQPRQLAGVTERPRRHQHWIGQQQRPQASRQFPRAPRRSTDDAYRPARCDRIVLLAFFRTTIELRLPELLMAYEVYSHGTRLTMLRTSSSTLMCLPNQLQYSFSALCEVRVMDLHTKMTVPLFVWDLRQARLVNCLIRVVIERYLNSASAYPLLRGRSHMKFFPAEPRIPI